MRFGPLVTGTWLRAHRDDPDLVLIDFRWSLGDPAAGRVAYGDGHIPGARFVDLEDVTGTDGGGRHPLPTPAQLTVAMRAAGVDAGSRVVVYDDAGGSVAARLWWLLRAHGHGTVAILDGGLQAWPGARTTAVPSPATGDFDAGPRDVASVLDADAVATLGARDVLIDARAPDRYAGESEPVDPRAGHIPQARNAFWKGNLRDDGTFLAPEQLAQRFGALGVTPGSAVVYCGSGVTACHDLLAIERAGLGPVRLYAGSWSDWCSRPERPVEVGAC